MSRTTVVVLSVAAAAGIIVAVIVGILIGRATSAPTPNPDDELRRSWAQMCSEENLRHLPDLRSTCQAH
ncbi:hypothetical protein ACFWY9_30630 [Amycolatopsis sp. NPDC059027]|uniref:hypothetical protein n=1 Tax=Amycolatopsis sp. NPDC059027 TaxID=3346709 RepID=UPI00366AD72C